MHTLSGIRKRTHSWAVLLTVLALLLVPAVPVHAEEEIADDFFASSDYDAETYDDADTAAESDDESWMYEDTDTTAESDDESWAYEDTDTASDDIIAQERDYYIKSLSTDITVREDNTFNVEETCVFNFIEPHHGPVREIPGNHYRYYEDGTKSRVIAHVSNFRVTSPDANTDVSKEDGSYYIGSSDETYTGEHTYVMSYTYSITSPDPLKDADELYYNIVGTGWACPIESASWKITMPSSFDADNIGYSVGTYESAGYSPEHLSSSVNGLVISGSYNTALYPYEGITIRCELPEGYFTFHSHKVAAWIAIALLLLIPLIVTLKNWKRSRQNVVPVVNFYPPKGMNPLDVEEIWSGKTDHKVALIPYLANRGYFTIEEPTKGEVRFRLQNNDFSALKEDERIFLEGMFPNEREIGTVSSFSDLKYKFYDTLSRVDLMHESSVRKQIHGRNLKGLMHFLALAEMALCPAIYTAYVTYTDDLSSAMSFGIIAVIATIFGTIFQVEEEKYKEGSKKSVVVMIISAACMAGIFFFICRRYSIPIALIMLCAGFLNFLAADHVMYRTEENLKYYGDVLGYRNFIEKADLQQLKMLSLENPSYFYFTLAYAYVFDLESKWISQFEKYNIPVTEPTWYVGYRPFALAAFRNDFDHVMQASSTAMRATPPSQSGGSGHFSGGGFSGGGFSGGGSGGGGGGAW